MFFNQSEVEFPNWWDDLGKRNEDDESGDPELSETSGDEFPEREENPGHTSPTATGGRIGEGDRTPYSLRSQGYDQEILRGVWEYAEIVPGNDPALWRKDEFGNWMYRLDYGNRNSEFGWEVFDPGIGRHQQGIYVMRPMQWQSYLKAYDILGA